MKLEVGMYVRTKDGISKCIKVIPIRENSFMYEFDKEVYEDVNFLTYSELEKYKSSSNIIDLIEVGDYVNGHRVIFVNETFTYASVEVETSGGANCEIIPKKDIKSIVTKEQMEQMAYKVVE